MHDEDEKRHRTTPKASKQILHSCVGPFLLPPVVAGGWWCVVVNGGCVWWCHSNLSLRLCMQTSPSNFAFKIFALHVFELRAAAFASSESIYLRGASCYRALQVCVRFIVVNARCVSFFFLRRPVAATGQGASITATIRAWLRASVVMDARR